MKNIFLILVAFSMIGCGKNKETDLNGGYIVGGSIMSHLPIGNYRGVEMKNLGIGGQSCKTVVDSLLLLPAPELIILNCGHNAFDPIENKKQWQRAIDYSMAMGIELIILNLNPIPQFPERLESIKELNQWLNTRGVEVLDFYSFALESEMKGLHPTAAEYENMIQTLFDSTVIKVSK